jgi:archaeal flagellar protein FlaJ
MKQKIIIPFSFLPPEIILLIADRFQGVGAKIGKLFPYLKLELAQSEMPYSDKQYGAIMFVLFLSYFFIGTIVFFILGLRFAAQEAIFIAPTAAGILALLILTQLSFYPKIQVKKKVRDVERNLIFALRTVLVQIRSGVSLFDSLNVVAQGNYGAVSTEFRKALDEINTGMPEEDALQKLALNNPSHFFRRSIWQLVNGMRAGADVSQVIKELVNTMVKEETIEIRKYGADLRLLSLIYMMLGVIVPALGLTFLIILSSFPQINIPQTLFWMLMMGVITAQFMYLGIIKSKRPNLMES